MSVSEKATTKSQHTDVYLCQVRNGLSCSACCGLYNRVDASRLSLKKILKNRTESFFNEIEHRLNRAVTVWDFKDNPRAIEAVRDFLYLKVDWPFRPETHTGPCNYFFEDQTYRKPPVIYGISGGYLSSYHIIFQELVSAFHSMESLKQAESIIRSILERTTRSLSFK